ncbi:hypothetical protein D9615_008937 [Tricholomella constricta]|uniref:F-box domain-containing protein n=1 Tax=Tricholomella constricta TaxID=117010 RepID=A0A8H5H0V9_9AGAR|nr:hypothetical protein D9615_008937 [Tricholomella constricta]
MYCDDDLLPGNDFRIYGTWKSFPYLRIFEEDEAESRSLQILRKAAAKEEGTVIDNAVIEASTLSYVRAWRVLGFFKSLEGVHKRLFELQTTWNAYLADFIKLSIHVKKVPPQQVALGNSGRFYTVNDYDFEDEASWNAFLTRWKIPEGFDFDALLTHTQRTLETMAKNPIPPIQQLCLVDLPTELLALVFEHAELSMARLLSLTCRKLNEIGRRFIHRTRNLFLEFPRDAWKRWSDSGLSQDQFLPQVAYESRINALALCDFLLGRQDLLDDVRDLYVSDRWFMSGLLDSFEVSSLDNGQFHIPLYSAFTDVVTASHNLTSLTFTNIVLSLPMVRCICGLSGLSALDLRSGGMSLEGREALMNDGRMILSSNIIDLCIRGPANSIANFWYCVLFCPRLRNFSAQSNYDDDSLPSPPEALWPKCRFFQTLEFLYLKNISHDTIIPFAAWIANAMSLPRLTHVKLHTSSGMPDHEMMLILRALEVAPLRVLSIDGLEEADFALFDSIAQLFPDLVGLTLSRRASDRQRRTRSVKWPGPEWQYASLLAQFTKLRHFGWNNDQLYGSFSTYTLLHFEEGFIDLVDFVRWGEARENEWLEEGDWTPKLFAIHCPTLETFSYTKSFDALYLVRTSDGVIVTKVPPWGARPYHYSEWDPSDFEGRWPRVRPEKRTDELHVS